MMPCHKDVAPASSAGGRRDFSDFSGKRVLLLQGPVGPFFWNLAKDLRAQGAQVFKFNFNAGDWLFYPCQAERFTGSLCDWHALLERFVLRHQIDAVMLFGDCRPLHAMVRPLSEKLGFAVGVFEEGYMRPDHVTFEPKGVNGHSGFSEDLTHWLQSQVFDGTAGARSEAEQNDLCCSKADVEPEQCFSTPHYKVDNTYWYAACWGMLYFFAAWIGQWWWNNQLHHRRLSITDAPWWWLSFGRKQWYRWTERGVQARLTGPLKDAFFLVPLQVHNDAQIKVHSDYDSVCRFIDAVMRSFSAAIKREHQGHSHANSLNTFQLVFKHHPMDRGYRNYAKAIQKMSNRYGLQDRVMYIHDQHLPSLLKACRGVVVVNSTTGLSALGHGAAVKVCGTALYDVLGLTYRGNLSSFWHDAEHTKPDSEMLARFKRALLLKTQLNGSYYRKLPDSSWACGVMLGEQLAARLWPAEATLIRKNSSESAGRNFVSFANSCSEPEQG